MLRSKQAVQVDSSQLDLIALRLPKPRPASRRPSLRLASFREFLEQTVVRHRHLRDHSESESRYAEPSKRSKGTRPKDSHALRVKLRSSAAPAGVCTTSEGHCARKSVVSGKRM